MRDSGEMRESSSNKQPNKAWLQQLRHCDDTIYSATRDEVISRVLKPITVALLIEHREAQLDVLFVRR